MATHENNCDLDSRDAGESQVVWCMRVLTVIQVQLKNTLGWTTVVFCECELILLFSLILCLIRTVYKFYVWLVIDLTNHRRRPVEDNRFCEGRFKIRQDADGGVFFARSVPTLPRSKVFSSIGYNACRRTALILVSFPAKCPFFKHRSLQDALSSSQAPMEQALTYAAVCIAVHIDRKQWKFAFINANIAESASEWCATLLRRNCLSHLNPTLYIPITDFIKSVRCS